MYEQHNYKKKNYSNSNCCYLFGSNIGSRRNSCDNYRARPAYAITFGSTKNLSNNDGDSTNPQVQVSSSNVYTVWEDKTKGDGDTFFQMYHTFPFTHDIYIVKQNDTLYRIIVYGFNIAENS